MASVFTKAFPAAVKEIRLHLSPSGAPSAGARQFLSSHYKSIKSSNPSLPFLIREAQNTPARVFVRFERGVEKNAEIDGLEASAVEKKISDLLA
ncbi:hypothetical protein Malapachy_0839 [Malassezia pachydermatis]|uniref:Ribosomal protein/NADH dehydrogenase domain-containing protein n=1 Tax=Malassezia pachydermatis TaxID=77020 RepID=A0A0M8MQP1_9BASI|nr:hypothetical protein Malapachy_0839 [Malassezia pachydermatis]KOS14907.1 hypothetical protein Malapachy_0839 [Malassezia pachydermatis]